MEILLKKEDDMKIHCQEVIFISKEAFTHNQEQKKTDERQLIEPQDSIHVKCRRDDRSQQGQLASMNYGPQKSQQTQIELYMYHQSIYFPPSTPQNYYSYSSSGPQGKHNNLSVTEVSQLEQTKWGKTLSPHVIIVEPIFKQDLQIGTISFKRSAKCFIQYSVHTPMDEFCY